MSMKSVHEELTGTVLNTLFSNEYDLKSAEANHSCFSPLKPSDISAHLTSIVKDCGVILA